MASTRRLVLALAAGAGLLTAYAAGLATPRGGSADPVRPDSSLAAAAARISASAAEPVTAEELQQAAVTGMLSALHDRWARYYPPADAQAQAAAVEGRFTSVGLWLRESSRHLVVASVTGGSPAARAGVRPGDVVASVAGAVPVSVPQAADLLRGAAGTSVDVRLRRGGRALHLSLERVEVGERPVSSRRLAGGALLVRVESFTRGTGREVRAVLAAEPHAQGVVLDLRGNPGGLLDEGVEVASIFLHGGAVVSYDRRDQPAQTLTAVGTPDTTTPLVVLVDGGTASAAEVVVGALQDRGRGVVVGSRTYGKGSVQETFPLPDGAAVELTVGHYRTPLGRDLDGVGIAPDVQVAADAPATVAERRAATVLLGLRASLPR
ncbi:S41 family peptidase [Motilibacter rhizosphaerae]|nr:S41 family peptidase [Motilibacter rhizosphaerae]